MSNGMVGGEQNTLAVVVNNRRFYDTIEKWNKEEENSHIPPLQLQKAQRKTFSICVMVVLAKGGVK